MQDWNSLAPGGAVMVASGVLGWLANWWRQNRKDVHGQALELLAKQGDRITFLEGRLEQVTSQLSSTLTEGANTRYELGVTVGKLEAANETIIRLEAANVRLEQEIEGWQRRWDEHFPKESE